MCQGPIAFSRTLSRWGNRTYRAPRLGRTHTQAERTIRVDRSSGSSLVALGLCVRRPDIRPLGYVVDLAGKDVFLNWFDWVVLLVTIIGIALYGVWRTRGPRDLNRYLRGEGNTSWIVIGLSVMATQASAITFISTPGQGFESGLGFVQNYFGAPFALILIATVFLPIYRRLYRH